MFCRDKMFLDKRRERKQFAGKYGDARKRDVLLKK